MHITSARKPGSDATVGERSNFKNFLRTRKIMVMHSNKRGECCLRTLVDHKWKRYDNAVDVVEHLRDPTDQVPNVRHLRVLHTISSMTSLELLIQQSVKEAYKFPQPEGMVTVMMLLPTQSFA